jgi:hypothetical protein
MVTFKNDEVDGKDTNLDREPGGRAAPMAFATSVFALLRDCVWGAAGRLSAG